MNVTTSNKRLLALDVMRGITIAGMILVNTPGSWQHAYAPLKHAEWIGLTPTDLVFPFFMFIMGISTYISLRKYNFTFSVPAGLKILKRTVIIFLIGIGISWLSILCFQHDPFPIDQIRILGVMQRLALGYGVTAIVALLMKHKYIPYYDSPYVNDPHDVSIKLQDEWLTELLKKEAYILSGDKVSDLEKVYIQEYLHYFNAPIDQYVNIMRSGVPMKNSSILPRKEFDEQLGDSYPIPRRFAVMEPLESDQLHDITIAAYKAQGYTYQGTNAKNPQVLHDERVWMDKENPDFGKGPKN